MNSRQMENQKRILAAKYGVKKSQITDKDVETYRSETNKEGAKQGAGIVGVGGTGATVGGKAIVDAQREANKLKTLEGLRNKAKQEKQKKEAFEYINELYMEKVASLQIY